MGGILSWFRKPSTKQLLEDIQEELDSFEDRRRDVEQRTRCIGRYVVYSFVLYLLVGLCTYWYWLPRSFNDWLKFCMPFAAFPPLVMAVKRLLHWYYARQLRNTRGKVEKLRQRKREILDQVMETETYKVAKEILQQYAPEQLTPGLRTGVAVTPSTTAATPTAGSTVRRRDMTGIRPLVATPAVGQRLPLTTPVRPRQPFPATTRVTAPPYTPRPAAPAFSAAPTAAAALPRRLTSVPTPGQSMATPGASPPGVPLPRPVAPRERGMMDRLIDYMMKEGPSNSYALVCRQCETHNGMALKEEFVYIAYRCAYCHHWNPARKQRPVPPRLEPLHQPPPPPPAPESSSDCSGDSSDEDSDAADTEAEPRADASQASTDAAATGGAAAAATGGSAATGAAAATGGAAANGGAVATNSTAATGGAAPTDGTGGEGRLTSDSDGASTATGMDVH